MVSTKFTIAITSTPTLAPSALSAKCTPTVRATLWAGEAVATHRPRVSPVLARRWIMSTCGTGIVHADAAAVKLDVVELFNRACGRFDIFHRDKAKATRSASACVVNNDNFFHLSCAGKLILQVALRGANTQTKGTHDVGWWRRRSHRWLTTSCERRRRRSGISVIASICMSMTIASSSTIALALAIVIFIST